MPVTRSQVESVLISRCGKILAKFGLDGETIDGTNASLNDPIADGVRSLALAVVDISVVSDADLSYVADADVPQLLDVAECRALESALNNLDSTDEKVMQGEQDWAKFAARMESTIARRKAQLQKQYGIGLSSLTVATFDMGFQARWDDCP
jgi:hypothetical protein